MERKAYQPACSARPSSPLSTGGVHFNVCGAAWPTAVTKQGTVVSQPQESELVLQNKELAIAAIAKVSRSGRLISTRYWGEAGQLTVKQQTLSPASNARERVQVKVVSKRAILPVHNAARTMY